MSDLEKGPIEYQSQFFALLSKLTQLYLAGEPPPDELLKEAQEMGKAAQIPDFLLRLI